MYTLKGLFPEPKKEPKKNFIKENMKQLKLIQGKSPKEPKFTLKSVQAPRLTNQSGNSLAPVKSSPSSKSGKATLNVGKTSYSNVRKNARDVRIKKGDMAEFLKRKEKRQMKHVDSAEEDNQSEEDQEDSSGRCRDIGCQTVETNFHKESAKLTMLYPVKNEDSDSKIKASGDSGRHSPATPHRHYTPRRVGDSEVMDSEKRSRVNAILERKDTKDPYLPSGYQKGVVPKYLRTRKEAEVKEAEAEAVGMGAGEDMACPAGHVALPDAERKETLRMLRNSFAELVSELNKMPVKTDTLRMRNRKMELEKQLAKLEEGIKVFSRPRVFVKIGE